MQTDMQTQTVPFVGLTPEERAELIRDINSLFVHPEQWLDTPHHLLSNHKPLEFLEPGREAPLYNLIGMIKYGLFA